MDIKVKLKKINKTVIWNVIKACSSTFAMVYLANTNFREISIVFYCGLTFLFYNLYSNSTKSDIAVEKISSRIAVLFTSFMVLGNDFLGVCLDKKSIPVIITIAASIFGFFWLFKAVLTKIYAKWMKWDNKVRKEEIVDRGNTRKVFWCSFVLMWGIYFVYFLNQYPGSLSCDTRAQLGQAIVAGRFENMNPLINTLLITLCVQIGIAIGGTVNSGVAVYTLVQFTLASAIFSYAISVIYKKGFHRLLVFICWCFFALVPHNIVYATGMWKDSFFALIFLLTLVYSWELIENKAENKKYQYVILGAYSLIASLARNSGWSSLLAFCIFVFISARKSKRIMKVAMALFAGVMGNFLVVSCVYPLFASNASTNVTTAISVPIQQISRVVTIGCELTEEEKSLIDKLVDIERIPELYDETISDPVKFSINKKNLEKDYSTYVKLWIDLGMRYPKCYLDAYLALTKSFWYPDSSTWKWDARILENDFGVYRTPLLLKGKDITNWFQRLYEFPKGSVFNNHSTILWLIIVCLGYAAIRKNKIGMLLFVPILAIYGGLMFTSPVALFRYTYGAIVCTPFLVCIPYLKTKEN